MPTILYQWRRTKLTEPWKSKNALMKWRMTDEDAASFAKANDCTLTKVEGSGQEVVDYSGRGMPPRLGSA